MSVSTYIFVPAKKETLLQLMPKLIDDLNKWQRNHLDTYWKEQGFASRLQFLWRKKEEHPDLKEFTNGVFLESYDFRSFQIRFKLYSEQRQIHIGHTVHDYSESYEGEKIYFSVNKWGMHQNIMMAVAESVKDFGDAYYTPDGCNQEFIKLYQKND